MVWNSKEGVSPWEGRREKEKKEKEDGYFTVLPRACLLSPRNVASNWFSHSPQFYQEEVWSRGEKIRERIEAKVYEGAKRPSPENTS